MASVIRFRSRSMWKGSTRNSPLPNDVAGTTFSQEEGRGYGEGSVMVDRKTNKRYARREYGPICGEDSYEMKALVLAFSKKLKKKKFERHSTYKSNILIPSNRKILKRKRLYIVRRSESLDIFVASFAIRIDRLIRVTVNSFREHKHGKGAFRSKLPLIQQ